MSGTYDGAAKVPDYLEATVYNKEEAVIMVGNFADVKTPEQVKRLIYYFLLKGHTILIIMTEKHILNHY